MLEHAALHLVLTKHRPIGNGGERFFVLPVLPPGQLRGWTAAGMTGKPLIESDRVEGTEVYDPQGTSIGSIKRLMVEKVSGKVAYAVMSFGGFLGMGSEEHAVPGWR